MHNGIRMTTLVKRAMLICAGVLLTYVAFGSVHTALASTEDEAKSVQLVSEIQTSLAPKEAPKAL